MLNWPPVAVRVCITVSSLVTFIVAAGETVSDIGMNMKFEMVIDVPTDEPDAGDPLFDGVPLPQAARSRAPASSRAPAPNFSRVRTGQAADAVELKAIGVPLVVCDPGYMPIT